MDCPQLTQPVTYKSTVKFLTKLSYVLVPLCQQGDKKQQKHSIEKEAVFILSLKKKWILLYKTQICNLEVFKIVRYNISQQSS